MYRDRDGDGYMTDRQIRYSRINESDDDESEDGEDE